MSGRRTGSARRLRGLTAASLLMVAPLAGAGLVADVTRAEAQETGPAHIERSLDHAHRLLAAGRAEEANRVLESLLAEHPGSAAALALLFDVADRLGDPEAFLFFIAPAARRAGAEEPALQELWVRGLLRAGRHAEARAIAERWVGERDREPLAYASLAAAHRASGQPLRAIESLERGRRRTGGRAVYRDELAALYAEAGHTPETRLSLALLTLRLGVADAARPFAAEEAVRHLDAYVRAHPDSSMRIAELTAAVARGQLRAGRNAVAERLLREAPARDGSARHVLDGTLATLELARGNPEEARERLRRATGGEGVRQALRTRWISLLVVLEAADSMEVAWLGRGLAAAASGPAPPADADLALLVERWAARPARRGRAAALAYLADELELDGWTDAAVTVHETLVRDHADGPEAAAAMLALARHSLATDPGRSREWLEDLVTRFPDSAVAPLARRLLAEGRSRAPAGNEGS